MAHFLETNTEWLDHHNKTVTIDNLAYTVKVSTRRAIYPYEHNAISVTAECKNKDSRYYRAIRAQLGDDWVTDVLESTDLSADILQQLTNSA